MTIRTRLTLWYSGMLIASLMLMGGVLYYELVYENRPERPKQEREPVREQVLEIIVFYGVPTLALVLGGGWVLMRRTLAPVVALTSAAERVHAENLRERLARSGNGDELDRLTGVFNDMLGRLDDSFQRIRQFTLHASHELKTPLTILHGEIETLLRSGQPTPVQKDTLAGMLDEIQRLARIVDDLSLLTKAGAGGIAMERRAIRLDELVLEACEDARTLTSVSGIQIDLQVCETAALIGDRDRLRQVLLNLFDNAVKHNQRDGRIVVALRQAGDDAVIEIANTGPGIPADQLPLVFDPFYRGKEAQRTRREGSGLGLSIVQWIVHSHGGTVTVDSRPDAMTTFTVRLPRGETGPQAR